MASPRVSISPRAESDVRGIGRYVAEQSGRDRAEMVLERINKAIDLLAFMPGIGSTRHTLKSQRRLFSVRPWLIAYRPLKDGVHILRVLDGRRDLPSLLGDP